MKNDKLLTIITSLLFVSGLASVGWALFSGIQIKTASIEPPNLDCVHASQLHMMRRSDLGPLLEKDRQYKVLIGYYACNPVQRGDLVFFQFSDTLRPVVRVVRGIPGDRAEIRATDGGHWEVWVNDKPVQGADGPFRLSDPTTPLPWPKISKTVVVFSKKTST